MQEGVILFMTVNTVVIPMQSIPETDMSDMYDVPPKIKIYRGPTLLTGIELILSNRLYVAGWQLRRRILSLKKRKSLDAEIAIAFFGSQPVATALSVDGTVMAFCRKSQRRQGLASRCVRALTSYKALSASTGIAGSQIFWEKLNIFPYF
jgi:hypothetical protein